jgi:cupin 2 domain-containing protein
MDVLFASDNVRIERIVSRAAASPEGFWYDQIEDEWVIVLDGHAVLSMPDGRVSLAKGDTLFIPAQTRHRVESTSDNPPCLWLCVFIKIGPAI